MSSLNSVYLDNILRLLHILFGSNYSKAERPLPNQTLSLGKHQSQGTVN